jgi:hypothetical protein
MNSMRIRSVAALAVILVSLPLEAATIDLQLASAITEGRFDFTRLRTETANDPPPLKRDSLIGSTASYEVWMDPSGVEDVSAYDYFTYELYVRSRANPQQVTRVVFSGKPVGPFDDQLAEVGFKVSDGTLEEAGTITLPVFGSVTPSAISSNQPDKPYEVYLATDKYIPVPVTNDLKRMAVTIMGATASSNDPALWKPIEITGTSHPFAPFLLGRGATDRTNLGIKLIPRTAHAFATALVRGRSKNDDFITVVVTYKTIARDPKQVEILLAVEFVPWPPFLLLVAVGGSLVGWLLLLLVKAKREKWDDRFRILGCGAAAAILVEVFGMLLVIGKSELKILDFTLDPFQMPTAALIGILSGLAGYKSREFLRTLSQMTIFKLGDARRADGV